MPSNAIVIAFVPHPKRPIVAEFETTTQARFAAAGLWLCRPGASSFVIGNDGEMRHAYLTMTSFSGGRAR